jgi:hypothetical protein
LRGAANDRQQIPNETPGVVSLFLGNKNQRSSLALHASCFFSREETGPPDLESEWAAFFNCEAVNERICCQIILICLLLARNGTEIEEGESLIEGSEGIQVL